MTLFESESTCGGHTLTYTTSSGHAVDLGFQVFNLTTYPHLQGFFEEIGIDSEPSDMSFALSVDSGKLEWASHSLGTVFCQKKNLFSVSFLNMLYEVIRFGQEAPKVLESKNHHIYGDMTLKEYIQTHGYSDFFQKNYILPMCAAVWSVPAVQVLQFPIIMLIRFWVNHHLLDIVQRPLWRVVKNRSREYVKKVVEELPDVRTACPVRSVISIGDERSTKVSILSKDGEETFDSVVLATHSDVSLDILGESVDEKIREVLSAIPYSHNDVWLHQDDSLMPKNRNAWASWNCIESRENSEDPLDVPVCVSYWVNSLQDLGESAPDYFVTLNPVHEPAKEKVIRRITLSHPIFGPDSVVAQEKLQSIQGKGGLYFCGAWCGYGFHEDGIKSSIEVLHCLGGKIPWTPKICSPKTGIIDNIAIRLFDAFAKQAIQRGKLRLILPNGHELVYGSPEEPIGGMEQAWRNRPPLNATLRIYNTSFFRKIISRHDTGLGEAYMDGDFEAIEGMGGSGDLGSLMAVITVNATSVESNRGLLGIFNKIGDKLLTWAHAQRSNTAAGSRINIEEHYDAGNSMYKTFLDPSMTYSCGIWNEGEASSLQESQENKLDALIEKAEIGKNHKVLEVGCGWGSFAIRAASTTGCQVVGLTLSKEQLEEATKRVKAAGLEEKIQLLYCDYRDTPNLGSYDRVVSCEMIEAVGHEHLPAYFATLGAAVKPGGKVVLQVIAAADERYEAYCKSSDFIREHIFPGGHLPSVGACVEAAKGTGLTVHNITDIGEDYAVTLRKWRESWESRKEEILQLGYSEKFWRKYRFYFVYCEAGFDAKYIHTYQITWVKDREFTLTRQQLEKACTYKIIAKVSSQNCEKYSLFTVLSSFVSAVQLSKGETSTASTDGLLASASESPSMLTQFLICLYVFLSGIAVSKNPVLWLSPFSTFAAALVYLITSWTSSFLQFHKGMSPSQSSLWNLYSTHIIYSSISLFCVVLYASSHSSITDMMHPSVSLGHFSRSVVASSAGFFGFVLWVEVNKHLFSRSYLAFFHYVLMLILFSAAAYKNTNVHLMCLGLVSEAYSIVRFGRKLFELRGLQVTRSQAFKAIEILIFITCRLLPHAGILATIALTSKSFPSSTSYWIALLGMFYMNAVNLRHFVASFGRKPHLA